MQLPISDEYQFKLYLAPFSQNSSVIDDDRQTDGRTDRRQPYEKLDRYLDTIG